MDFVELTPEQAKIMLKALAFHEEAEVHRELGRIYSAGLSASDRDTAINDVNGMGVPWSQIMRFVYGEEPGVIEE